MKIFQNLILRENKIIFGELKFDLFNLFHGPISDSLHQYRVRLLYSVVTSGNPIPRGVKSFYGNKNAVVTIHLIYLIAEVPVIFLPIIEYEFPLSPTFVTSASRLFICLMIGYSPVMPILMN